jgi:hypothetical protein
MKGCRTRDRDRRRAQDERRRGATRESGKSKHYCLQETGCIMFALVLSPKLRALEDGYT